MQTDVERSDADKVDMAQEQFRSGNVSDAEALLRDVCSRCIDEYQYEWVSDGTRYIKFWDAEEFMAYVTVYGQIRGEKVIWLRSAYPRACHQLAYILVERGDLSGAVHWLEKGRAMEPTNAKFLLELGVVNAHLNEHQKSYDCFRQGLDSAIFGHDRAVALRGMGVQLIDLQRLDDAETCLEESLSIEPENEGAKRELGYIAQLRSGHHSQPQKPWWQFWG